jgi:hypothetical protein
MSDNPATHYRTCYPCDAMCGLAVGIDGVLPIRRRYPVGAGLTLLSPAATDDSPRPTYAAARAAPVPGWQLPKP